MRILVTGSFGNIGRNVLELLLHTGYQVRCFDRETERNRGIAASFRKAPWNARRIKLLWGDIRNKADVQET